MAPFVDFGDDDLILSPKTERLIAEGVYTRNKVHNATRSLFKLIGESDLDVSLAQEFLDKGGDVNAFNVSYRGSISAYAVQHGDIAALRFLLLNGASPQYKLDDLLPVELAFAKYQRINAERLCHFGANLMREGSDGKSTAEYLQNKEWHDKFKKISPETHHRFSNYFKIRLTVAKHYVAECQKNILPDIPSLREGLILASNIGQFPQILDTPAIKNHPAETLAAFDSLPLWMQEEYIAERDKLVANAQPASMISQAQLSSSPAMAEPKR